MLPSNVVYTLAVYAVGGLCQAGLLPWLTLPCALLAIFSRWAFDIHTRTHFKGRYPLIEELMLLIMSPLSVGLSEQRESHRRHHAALGTTADPDALYYSAHPLAAIVLCLLQPEITFLQSLPSMSLPAKVRAGVRCYLFIALWAIGGANFLLWYLLPLRLLFATAQFVFTWGLHHRDEERTIDIHVPSCFTLLLGSTAIHEFGTHTVHHHSHHHAAKAISRSHRRPLPHCQ